MALSSATTTAAGLVTKQEAQEDPNIRENGNSKPDNGQEKPSYSSHSRIVRIDTISASVKRAAWIRRGEGISMNGDLGLVTSKILCLSLHVEDNVVHPALDFERYFVPNPHQLRDSKHEA